MNPNAIWTAEEIEMLAAAMDEIEALEIEAARFEVEVQIPAMA